MTRNAGKRESRALPRLAGLGAPLYIISGHLLIHTHPPAHAPTVGKQPMGGAPDTVILLSMKRSMRVCACSREHPRGRRQPPSSRHPREPGPPASCPVAGPRTGRRRAIVPRPRVCVQPLEGSEGPETGSWWHSEGVGSQSAASISTMLSPGRKGGT